MAYDDVKARAGPSDALWPRTYAQPLRQVADERRKDRGRNRAFEGLKHPRMGLRGGGSLE
jgi:hypothetical protein